MDDDIRFCVIVVLMISLILPVHNEEDNLKDNFPRIYRALSRLGSFEIIIVEDGSADRTLEIAKKYAKMKHVKLISDNKRAGKGRAIKNGIDAARGSIIGFIDIDLAVPLKYLEGAIRHVRDGSVFVIGNRYDKSCNAERSIKRLIESASYNAFIRLLFGSRVRDHQCGFKFWSSAFIKKEIKEVKDDRWFFDTELIVRSARKGILPYEMPVEWHEGRKSNVSSLDIFYFVKEAVRMKING